MAHDISHLHRFIVEHFDLEELRALCFDLGIEYENLGGVDTRDARARELVLRVGRQRRFEQLLAELQQARPAHFQRAGLSTAAPALDALYAGLAPFEARTRPLHQRILERLGLEQRVGFVVLGILAVALAAGGTFFLYRALRPRSPARMAGDFRIAVAGFAESGRSGESETGTELAHGVYLRLEQALDEIDLGFTIAIWGPDQVGTIAGQDRDARARSAAQLAAKIGADVVVYGHVDTGASLWQVTPEFYVAAENFYEAEEITGQHDLGVPLSIGGQGNVAARIAVSEAFTCRARALSRITVGLAYYAVRDFRQALALFQSAEEIEGWQDGDGKQVLYLLIGNSAGRAGDLELARAYHEKSLALDPEYARAYVGLASATYMQALKPYEETGDPTRTDVDLLRSAIATYERAAEAAHQPVLSDIPAKVHFGLGQCYFVLVYSENEELFDPAIAEFEAVIAAYGDGTNPRVLEITVESYARLGLIYDLSGHPDLAVEKYEMAASLSSGNPERQALYEERARTIEDRAAQPGGQ